MRMIVRHIGESPGEIATASLSQIPVHGPEIRVLPGQIISLQTHGAGEARAGNARKKYTKMCYTQGSRENSRPDLSNG